jgi:hypothetical protein
MPATQKSSTASKFLDLGTAFSSIGMAVVSETLLIAIPQLLQDALGIL